MALGRQHDNGPRSTLMFLSPRIKNAAGDKVDPHFTVRKNVDGTWQEVDTTDRFSGALIDVKSKEIPLKKGGKMEMMTLTFEDKADPEKAEKYVVDFGFKVATRGLFNRLLNLETYNDLEVSYWENDRGFDVLSIRQNGTPVLAKYAKEDTTVPAVKEVTLRGEVVRDYMEVDEFYKKELLALNDKIKAAADGGEEGEASGETDGDPGTVAPSTPKTAPRGKGKGSKAPDGLSDDEIPF